MGRGQGGEHRAQVTARHTGLTTGSRREALTSALLEQVRDDERFASCRRVLVDIDGTIFPLVDALERLGIELPKTHEIDLYDEVIDAVRASGRDPGEVFRQAHDLELMKETGVYDGAPNALQELHTLGVEIHVVSHRHPDSAEATVAWLEAAEIPYDHLEISFADKMAYCREHEIEVVVDDHPDLIERSRQAGMGAVSLHWPYAAEAIREHAAESAGDWHEMGHDVVRLLEERVRMRAAALGLTL